MGDLAFQNECLGKMGDVSQGRTVLFVSHNMAAVANLSVSDVAGPGAGRNSDAAAATH